MEAQWTIDELDAQAALALATDYNGPPNERVRHVPDRRTIRYYTTLGLLDRPATMRGRTALYGRKHLLQLVAIKRLQSHGLSLAEIQTRLLGLTPSALARIAKLPGVETCFPESSTESERDRADFWRAVPSRETPATTETEREILQGVPLAEGVVLLLHCARELDDDDLQALRSTAGPLLKLITTRRLIRPRPARSNS